MNIQEDMRLIVNELIDALQRYDELRFDEIQPRELGPPATPNELRDMERTLRFPIPPSWRAFLCLHNGWSNFRGTAKLLATSDLAAPWVRQRIRDWEDLLEGKVNPFGSGRQPVMLGMQESSFLVIDPGTLRADGEMSFTMYDYLEEEHRFPDLVAFLRHHLSIVQALVDRHSAGPSR